MEETQQILFVDYKEGVVIDLAQKEMLGEDRGDQSRLSFTGLGLNWCFVDSILPDMVFIPEKQNLDNWQEMITIQRLDAQGQKSKKLYDELVGIREEHCPGKSTFRLVENERNRLLYQCSSEACGYFEPQTAMAVILSPSQLIVGQYTLWRVEYTVKGSQQEARFSDEVFAWFQHIELLTGKDLKNQAK
ncbi:hypothetical protein [Mangrovibacterium lignilyticum]|uniref:hypothetical protein n=1 Tax=Mangrovibacterium lignilyticum TaxID=2668052 RepID=UPI0013D8883B|nr:hypothetical protein [Mangrovibacterium lignilyticum]